MPSPIFEPAPATAAIVELLAKAAPGELLTWELIGAVADDPDIRQHQHLMQSALRIAEREHGVVFANERARGYRRLATEQIPHVEVKAARHQRRTAAQTIKTLIRGVEKANDVPPETQLRLNQGLARQGVIARVTSPRLLQDAGAAPAGAPLPSVPEIARRLLDRARQRPAPRRLTG